MSQKFHWFTCKTMTWTHVWSQQLLSSSGKRSRSIRLSLYFRALCQPVYFRAQNQLMLELSSEFHYSAQQMTGAPLRETNFELSIRGVPTTTYWALCKNELHFDCPASAGHPCSPARGLCTAPLYKETTQQNNADRGKSKVSWVQTKINPLALGEEMSSQ